MASPTRSPPRGWTAAFAILSQTAWRSSSTEALVLGPRRWDGPQVQFLAVCLRSDGPFGCVVMLGEALGKLLRVGQKCQQLLPQRRRHIKGDRPRRSIGPQLREAGLFLVDCAGHHSTT